MKIMNIKTYACFFLILESILLSSATAETSYTDLIIGNWDYSYHNCEHTKYGFTSAGEAEDTGMNVAYPSNCGVTTKIEDDGFPPEGDPQPRPISCSGGYRDFPEFVYGVAHRNNKRIKVEFHQWSLSDPTDCVTGTGPLNIRKNRTVGCPGGVLPEYVTAQGKFMCKKVHDPENDGNQCGTNAGNPINTATGNKFHEENIELNSDLIPFSAFYNSSRAKSSALYGLPMGRGWTHTYSKKMSQGTFLADGIESIYAYRETGRGVFFQKINGVWVNQSSSSEILSQTVDGWVLHTNQGEIEKYDIWGKLVEVVDNGRTVSITYESGSKIDKITADDGTYVTFGYSNNSSLEIKPQTITDHVGNEWRFNYTDRNMLEEIIYPDNTIKSFHYETSSRLLLTGITNRHDINQVGQRFATYGYDSEDRANYEKHHVTDPDVHVEELKIDYDFYPGEPNKRKVTNSRGKVSTYEVEQNNGIWQIKSITGPGCSSCSNDNSSFEYDPVTNDLISKTVDGVTTKYYNYDSKGQYAYKIEAFGTTDARRTDYTYDSRFIGKVTSITEPSVYGSNNKVTNYVYDLNGQMTSMTVNGFKPDGTAISKTTTYEYNGPFNQISRMDGPRPGNVDETVYQYYADTALPVENRNRLEKVTGPAGIIERDNIQWSATGKIKSEDRPNGLTLINFYDADTDRVDVSSLSDNATAIIQTQFTYLPTGHIQSVKRNYGSPEETTLTLTYDGALRVTRVTDQLGNYVEYELDTEGNQLGERTYDLNDVLKKQIIQTFDDYDFLATMQQSGVTTTYDYGSNGTLDSQTNGNSVNTEYSYDTLKRLSQINQDYQGTNPLTANTTTSFTYDAGERVKTVTDARGNITTYHYDDFGNLITLVSPDTGTTSYVYDEAGNMTSKTDAKGVTVGMSYDGRGRITFIDYTDNSLDTTYVYDQGTNGIGQLSSFTDQTGSTTFSYDGFGNQTNKIQVVGGFTPFTHAGYNNLDLDYDYDDYNRIEKMTYPSGLELTYEYDDLNQVQKITTTIDGQAETVVDLVTYLPFGPVKSINFGNGKNYNANYDDGYRLIDYNYGVDVTAAYAYDNNHNITTITRELTANNDGFSYDALDRLTYDSHESTTLTYDQLGNRTSKQEGINPTVNYTIDANSNKMLNVGAVKPRGYDANGNTLSAPDMGDHAWLYDQANRMSDFGTGRNAIAEYFHNGIGQRIRKKINGTDYLFVYDEQGQLVHESAYIPGSHLWDRETIWLGNRPVARVETSSSGDQNFYYIQTDHLNTPRWITNDAGVRIWSWESDAFGTTAPDEDVDGDQVNFEFNMRFPGQYYDAESGLNYNYFRDYDPGTSRYVQSDPIGQVAGWNTYTFVLGNPVNYFDPNGAQTEATLGSCAIGGPINPACDAAIIINACKYVGLGIAAAWGYFSDSEDNENCDEECKAQNDKRKSCEALKQSILATCAGLSHRKMFACFHAAQDAYDQCMSED